MFKCKSEGCGTENIIDKPLRKNVSSVQYFVIQTHDS